MGTRIKLNNADFFCWGFDVQNKWLEIRIANNNLGEYFFDNYINKVAVYGAGALGRRLVEELVSCGIDVVCIIDKNADKIEKTIRNVPVLSINDQWPDFGAVVVTPIFFYEIRKDIKMKADNHIDIIAIDDVVDYCYGKLKRQ